MATRQVAIITVLVATIMPGETIINLGNKLIKIIYLKEQELLLLVINQPLSI